MPKLSRVHPDRILRTPGALACAHHEHENDNRGRHPNPSGNIGYQLHHVSPFTTYTLAEPDPVAVAVTAPLTCTVNDAEPDPDVDWPAAERVTDPPPDAAKVTDSGREQLTVSELVASAGAGAGAGAGFWPEPDDGELPPGTLGVAAAAD